MLKRKIIRTLLNYKAQMISMLLMIILGVGIFWDVILSGIRLRQIEPIIMKTLDILNIVFIRIHLV